MRYREGALTAQDGLALYYRDYGDAGAPAPAAICLGGLTRNSKDYHDLALHLAPGRRVLCPDYRGRGRSAYDPDWRNYDPRVYVNDVIHLLAATNTHRAVVIGTSLGGLLAMGLAVAAPSALAGIVLNDVGPEIGATGLAHIVAYISADRPQPDLDAVERMLRHSNPQLSTRDPSVWRRTAENTFRQGDDGMWHFDWDVAIARPLHEGRSETPDLWRLYRALGNIPTLVLRGELSEILLADGLDRMKQAKPDLDAVVVPGTGHPPTLLEPESLAALESFLGRI